MNYIKKTSDGSTTIFVEELNEHYHSIHGAYNEAIHVFIKSGIDYMGQKKLKIFEVGFGTGLNALLTAIHSQEKNLIIDYHSIEKYPVAKKLIDELNYTEITGNHDLFKNITSSSWNIANKINSFFQLTKIEGDLKQIELETDFDLIYFDAFAPEKQENMWSSDIFHKMYSALKTNGVLVTYCAKGLIRRRMQEVGFNVSRIPGPPGKREMLRATKL